MQGFGAAAAVVLVSLWGSSASAQTAGSSSPATYVIVHGAWGGGWAWQRMDALLRQRGHTVYRPTLTGLGERAHLASPTIGLSTHIDDVVNVILYENLKDIVLVGHSYGGIVITGVADRVADRIRRLVYVDAFVPADGDSLMSIAGAPAGWLKQMTQGDFIVPAWVRPEQPVPHDLPHPLKTFTDQLVLRNAAARDLPATYILTIDPGKTEDAFIAQAERAKERGWTMRQMAADHNPHVTAPNELLALLDPVP
jgi:pimeloyl-ACP methyl ester carboxylesterase